MSQDVEQGKVCALLLWIIWIVGLIWFVADEKMRKNTFVKYWLKQWLIMLIVGIVVWIIGMILTVVTFGIFGFVMMLVWLAFLVLWIIGLVKIVQGKTEPVPIIGQFGEKWFKF